MNNNSKTYIFTKKIDSSAKDLWGVFISKPFKIHPFCKQNDVIEWNKKSLKCHSLP